VKGLKTHPSVCALNNHLGEVGTLQDLWDKNKAKIKGLVGALLGREKLKARFGRPDFALERKTGKNWKHLPRPFMGETCQERLARRKFSRGDPMKK